VIEAARSRNLRIIAVGRNADGEGEGIRLGASAVEGFAQQLELEHCGRRYMIKLPLVGEFQIENALVAAGLAKKCTIQISYAIGVADPLSFYVDLHGTGEVDEAMLEKALPEMMDGITPRAIREHLQLNRPIYARSAAYGHFGREPDNEGGFSWEKTDLVEAIRSLV